MTIIGDSVHLLELISVRRGNNSSFYLQVSVPTQLQFYDDKDRRIYSNSSTFQIECATIQQKTLTILCKISYYPRKAMSSHNSNKNPSPSQPIYKPNYTIQSEFFPNELVPGCRLRHGQVLSPRREGF
uniref:Uncharacterized protein n=1 Tax=Onchocerca volvulus TaxID=6282 RepID=A0A8R1TU59_ONCVO